MKKYWERTALKIDAMTLRERALVFAVAATVLITIFNSFLLDPQVAKQKILTQRLAQDQAKISQVYKDIQDVARAQSIDPDAVNRSRLAALQKQAAQTTDSLKDLQSRLVPPQEMASLLQAMLKRSGNVRLVSLKTISPVSLTASAQRIPPASGSAIPAATPSTDVKKDTVEAQQLINSVFRHGVELTVQGSYTDLFRYLKELEAMPWQVFWGDAEFATEEYPKATLTLTLYTLSLDKKWLNL